MPFFLVQDVAQPAVWQLLASIPPWLWGFVGVLVASALASSAYALVRLKVLERSTVRLSKALSVIGPQTDDVRLHGQPLAAVDRWREACKRFDGTEKGLAEDIERQLVAVIDPTGKTRYRLRDGDAPLWTADALADRFINLPLIDSTPSLLTAGGLVGTFIAIAYGLGGLRQLDSGIIDGVQGLLGGLGGKFVTSIAALALALLFQIIDVTYFKRKIARCHKALLDAVARTLPTQTAAQQMADLLASARKQEAALASISSDVVTSFGELFSSNLLPDLSQALASSLKAEIGPVLTEVATGIRALDDGIKRLESGKQESIGAELRSLTQNLGQSITNALREMGEQFRQSLSGTADREFEEASAALRSSADVLRGMNASFESMQASMQRLLADAEARAARTFEEGEGRTKALNSLVERLVSQLDESARTSAGEVQRLLVEAVSGMSQKMTEVTAELEDRVRNASADSLRTNQQLMADVTATAGRTTSETERLLATLGERSGDFVAAADQLRELREGVERILAQTGDKVRDLQEAASAFRVVATEARTLSQALRETQDQQRVTTEAAAGMVGRIGQVVQTQVQAADKAKDAFETADRIMDALDQQLDRTLQVIVSRMQDYNTQVEKNFDAILRRVNERMPELFERLEGSLQQVAETVEELNDTVTRTTGAKR